MSEALQYSQCFENTAEPQPPRMDLGPETRSMCNHLTSRPLQPTLKEIMYEPL